MARASYSQIATILNGENLSTTISFYEFASGVIHMPAAWTAADIAFQVASELTDTFQPLYDDAGNLVEISGPVAGRTVEIPASVLPSRFVKLWSESIGSGVNQGADRALIVDMKS